MRKIMILMMVMMLGGCTVVKPSPRPSFTLETYPKIYGSTVSIPLEELLMATLTDQTIETIRPYVPVSKTHEAYLLLINKTADLIFVTSPSAEELQAAATVHVELEITPITSEAFVFIVNKDNPIDSLSLEQIQKIYSGEITNWKDLGGEDLAIRAMQRPINSGSQTGFLDLVMKDLTVMTPPVEWVSADMGELVDMVAAYDNKPDAIGYSYYYYVTDMKENPNIKLLKVNGILPDPITIANSTYPIHTNYYAVLRKDELEKSDARMILKYLLSTEGQDLIEAAGYVRLK
jgi:phosphate transport system substrate-binding protein